MLDGFGFVILINQTHRCIHYVTDSHLAMSKITEVASDPVLYLLLEDRISHAMLLHLDVLYQHLYTKSLKEKM